MADTKSILQLGIEAAHAGDKAEARELFRLVTREKPDNVQGWLWLAGVAEDRDEKRAALERVIELDPNNDLARKGLAAMGGVAAASGAVAVASTTPDPAPAAPPVDEPGIAEADEPLVAAADSVAPEEATPVATDDNVRMYDTPDAPADDDTWTPAFADDDIDRRDDQQVPRADDDEYEPGVVVEDEEPERRGGIGWLPWVLGLIALALLAYLAYGFFANRNDTSGTAQAPGGVEISTTTEATSSAVAGGVIGGTDATATGGEGGLPIVGTTVPGDAGATAAPPVEGTAPPSEGAPAATQPATDPAGAEQTAPLPTDPAAEQTADPAANGAAPTDQPTVIVVVPPDTTVVPPATEAPAAPAPPATEPTAAPPAPAPTSAAGDVATANPAVVAPGTLIQAGPWSFQYNGARNESTSTFGGAAPTQGQYQIVVVNVANNSGQAAAIPDGFFVLKDAQGRVYEFNRAASVDYLNRFGRGVAADIAADEQVASTNTLVSTALLFDTAVDATNLVLLSRENVGQGFQIR